MRTIGRISETKRATEKWTRRNHRSILLPKNATKMSIQTIPQPVSMGIGNVLFNIDKDNIKACVVNNIDLAKQFILEKTFNGYKYNIVYAYVNQTLYKFNRKMVVLEDLSSYKK